MIATAAVRQTEINAAGYQNNPFLAWENLAATAELTGNLAAGSSRYNAVSGTTYDYWLTGFGAPNMTAVFPEPVNISFAALAAHNLASVGASVRVQRSINAGANWTDAGAGLLTPTDNSPLAWRMRTSGNEATHWRFSITGGTGPVAVGVLFLGNDLIVPQRIYQRFNPVIEANEVDLQSNVSMGGNLLGSSVTRRGASLSAEFEHLPATWVRGPARPFREHFNDGRGFFFGWRPQKYPEDLYYCWRDGGVAQTGQAGIRDLMTMGFGARAHAGS